MSSRPNQQHDSVGQWHCHTQLPHLSTGESIFMESFSSGCPLHIQCANAVCQQVPQDDVGKARLSQLMPPVPQGSCSNNNMMNQLCWQVEQLSERSTHHSTPDTELWCKAPMASHEVMQMPQRLPCGMSACRLYFFCLIEYDAMIVAKTVS